MTPRETEFEAVCRTMLDQGIKPTPANLYPGFGNGRTIRGNYVKIRTRLLEEYRYTGGGAPGSPWVKTRAD